jgi:hypothetical protein
MAGAKRACLLHDPPLELEDWQFGEHIDAHSDLELTRWPGGWKKLERELIASARRNR